MRLLVLGSGRMGRAAAWDMVRSRGVTGVTVADADLSAARAAARFAGKAGGPPIRPVLINAGDERGLSAVIRGHGAVLSALPYFANLGATRAAIAAGVSYCDLGGDHRVVEAQLRLSGKARAAGVTVIPDCGLAPGMVCILAADGVNSLDKARAIRMRVGGIPQNPRPPLNYQITWSPEGLLNEYLEPALVVRSGRTTHVPSLEGLEDLDFPRPFGRMEAFYTSGGISTLPKTLGRRVAEIDYKTIRYPGHAAGIKVLAGLGLASREPVNANGQAVAPRDVLKACLVSALKSSGPDVVIVRVLVEGRRGKRMITRRYDLIDRGAPAQGLSAMMRTTAFSASVIAQFLADGTITARGVVPQELAVPPPPYLLALRRRGLRIRYTESTGR